MRLQVFLRGARLNRLRKTPAKSLLSRRQVSIKHRALSSGALSSGARTAPIFWGGLRLTLLSRKPSKEIGVLSRNPPKKLKPHGATLDKALRLIEACLREKQGLSGGLF